LSVVRSILTGLVCDEPYLRKVLPYLRAEYFTNQVDQVIFETIREHVDRYNTLPTRESISIDADVRPGFSDATAAEVQEAIKGLTRTEDPDRDWLIDQTEEFCKKRAIYLALQKSLAIYGGKEPDYTEGMIPDLLTKALGVNFDNRIGIDYIEDAERMFDYYNKRERKIPFDIDYFNQITDGGVATKTLNILAAGTGGGKSLSMCHLASRDLCEGRDALYITFEITEEEVNQRIDANLLDTPMTDFKIIPRETYMRRREKLREKMPGRLFIKEYPETAAGANHFRYLLDELKLKKKFEPKVVYIDYLGLCCSSRIKASMVNSYTYQKAIAEELRGLAKERNYCCWTGAQLNRSGFATSEPGLEHTADSFGIAFTADLMLIMNASKEMEALQQVLFRQTSKNRYAASKVRRFVVGMDPLKQRLYNVEQSAQDVVGGEGADQPVFDKTEMGGADKKSWSTLFKGVT